MDMWLLLNVLVLGNNKMTCQTCPYNGFVLQDIYCRGCEHNKTKMSKGMAYVFEKAIKDYKHRPTFSGPVEVSESGDDRILFECLMQIGDDFYLEYIPDEVE